MYSKEYYQIWLEQLQRRQMDLVLMVLKREVAHYELEKTYKKGELMGLTDEPDFRVLKNMMKHQVNRLKVLRTELDDVDLDIEHCTFMIDRLNNLEP
jgi:hypothetical protein